jgi:zinc transport system substrate-binding protein
MISIKMYRYLLGAIGCLCCLLSLSCSDNGSRVKHKEVFVSIPPIAFIVKAVSGDRVKVCTMIPKGRSPHDYTPAPRQVAQLQDCRAFFTIGLPFEKQVIKPIFSEKPDRLIDISTGILRREIDHEHQHDHHSCNESCDHGHNDASTSNLDPHIWLSPVNDSILAKNAAAALSRLFPEDADYFQSNYKKFDHKLKALNAGLQKILKPYKGQVFYVYHPAFGYFADAFGMKQEAVETEGKSPTPKHLNELIAAARKDKVKIILVQPQFNERCADVIARALNAKVMQLDPLTDDLFDFYHKFAAVLVSGSSGKNINE